MSTATDIITILETITSDLLETMGEGELAKLLQAVEKLVSDVVAAIEAKKVNLPVQVTAADIAASIAEDQKFGKP